MEEGEKMSYFFDASKYEAPYYYFPKDVVVDPSSEDIPATPAPQVWGHSNAGEPYIAYAALYHEVVRHKGRTTDYGWKFKWFEDPAKAERHDREFREEVKTLLETRQRMSAVKNAAPMVALPVAVPQRPAEGSELEEEFRKECARFVWALREFPAYAYLPCKLQKRLAEAGIYGIPVTELQAEWPVAVKLLEDEQKGKSLANFGGHFRVMGGTRNRDYWVVRPDGSLREPDEIAFRKEYLEEGTKGWRIVGAEELALSWSKEDAGANHRFEVSHSPIGGCTLDQRKTVASIEQSIEARWKGRKSMYGELSPSIGTGWGLR